MKNKKAAKSKKSEKSAKPTSGKERVEKRAEGKSGKKASPKTVIPAKAAEKTENKTATPKAAKKEEGKKSKNCAEAGCNQPQLSDKYCRMHYIKYWRVIINGRKQQARVNLNKYIESISEQYPEEYMDKIKDDLTSDGKLRDRLRELGFREEYEGQGGDNPFQAENLNEFLSGIKVDD